MLPPEATAIYDTHGLLGGLGAIFALTTVVLGGLAIWRSGAVRAWRQAADGWKARCEERDVEIRSKDERLRECHDVTVDQAQTIARLEALPNLERLVSIMADSAERADVAATARTAQALEAIGRHFEDHERMAADRHRALVDIATNLVTHVTGKGKEPRP